MLVCNICNKEAKYRLILNCGRFEDRLFFCNEHKPIAMEMGEMAEKQSDTNINTILKAELESDKVSQFTHDLMNTDYKESEVEK